MDSRTNEMLFKCDEIVATISEHVKPRPGDICFTGPLSGSVYRHGDRWLRRGDTTARRSSGSACSRSRCRPNYEELW